MLRKLRCQGCGASVPVEEGLRFIDCAYCGSRLEMLGANSEAAELRAENEALKLREELRLLDAAWEGYVRQVSVKGRYGELHPPGTVDSGTVVFLCVALAMGAGKVLPRSTLLWILVVAVFGSWILWLFVSAASERKRAFNSARRVYDSQRRVLLRKLGWPERVG